MDAQQLLRLKPELDRFLDQFAPLFGRDENQAHARRFVQGLLRGGERRNSENIAEATEGSPVRSLQAFIATGAWSDRSILAQLRQAVVGVLADPDAVVNVDETGFPKKGTKSVGAKRQYSGTLGRVDNCQIGVFANYASSHGHAFLDRRLYLPEEWAQDSLRRKEAGVPKGVVFRTKPELALEMIEQTIEAKVQFRWVGGDSVYGDNPQFVQGVRRFDKRYVLDTACDTQVWTKKPEVIAADQRPKPARGRRPTKPLVVGERCRVDAVIANLPATAWRRVVVGEGSKGPRVYEYAEVVVWFSEDELPGPPERLLARRSIGQEPKVTYHRSNAPADVSLDKLAQVRGLRWTIEEDFQTGKGECGLDEYETRGWVGWHHHTALAMLALAFLVLQKRRLGEKRAPDDGPRSPGSAQPPAGGSRMGYGRDPEVVPLASRAEPQGRRQPPKTTTRNRVAALAE
jgi:SRSO17 transposase